MKKSIFKVEAENYDNADKLIKRWRKKWDNAKIIKHLKAIRYFKKPKETRKNQKSLSLHLQRMRTEKNR